jgi:hypothetical protein
MPTDLMQATAVRPEKHLIVLEKMNSVQMALESLESLADRIDPVPAKPGMGLPPMPIPSLARFLDQMPSDIMAISERISNATNRIKSAIL